MVESTTKLGSLLQVNMVVRDLERALPFYRDTLGLPFYFRAGNLCFLGMGDVRLLLEQLPEAAEERYHHPGSVLYFTVPDIQVAYRDLMARGVEFIEPPHLIAKTERAEVWMAFFSDGDWNTHAIATEVPVTA